jgi:glutamate transport system permease protein
VALPELLQLGVNVLSANFGNVVAAAIVAAAIYVVLNSLLTLLANWLDRRTQRRGLGAAEAGARAAAAGMGGGGGAA